MTQQKDGAARVRAAFFDWVRSQARAMDAGAALGQPPSLTVQAAVKPSARTSTVSVRFAHNKIGEQS